MASESQQQQTTVLTCIVSAELDQRSISNSHTELVLVCRLFKGESTVNIATYLP